VYAASITDGLGAAVSRRLFVVQTDTKGTLTIRQPTYLLDLTPAPAGTAAPDEGGLPDKAAVEHALLEQALTPFLAEVGAARTREVAVIAKHLEISLGELIHRANLALAELENRRIDGGDAPGLTGNIAKAVEHVDVLNGRLDSRRAELAMERQMMIGEMEPLGRAWVLPHPERDSPRIAPMVRDEEIERIAVAEAIRHEVERGWMVESVEKDNKGFDLVSRKPHPHDDKTFTDVRFIEVKGRAGVGDVALTANEHRTAQRLKGDYWLYVVFDCAKKPTLHVVQDPARLAWEAVVQVAHYQVAAAKIVENAGPG
jgi:hypothetical protein